jgi:hypothetical protein
MKRFVGVVLVSLVLAPGAAATPTVSFTMSGTAGSNGWFRSNVTINWVVTELGSVTSSTGCELAELVTTEGSSSHTCTVTFNGGSTSATATPKIDKTAPGVSAATPARAPDANGWYNHPVAFAFSGTDATSGIAGCSSPSYGGADGSSVSVAGTCTDIAGNASSLAVSFKYDATPPTVSPSVERPPDGKGWYRKPVTVSFAGSDATSGVAACTAPTRYSGPDQANASVAGSCRDAAGNTAEAGHRFQYDATAPALAKTEAKVDKGVARIGWERAGDVVEVELVRSPGINGAKSTIVYRGNGAAFVDKTVKAGIRYRYEISVADMAGNVTTKAVTAATAATAAKKSTSLLAPVAGAVVKEPPLLRWKAVKGAAFYNVQLYRNGLKLLSTWPGAAKLKLARTWTYAGKRYRLQPGVYKWYVWGARGTRAKPVYGKVLGSSTFSVKR